MTDLRETLQRLANRFLAHDIMTPAEHLVCADTEEQARRLLNENPQFDVIPLVSGGKILAFLERGHGPKRIQVYHTVSAGTPIPDIVDSLCDRPYCFVIGRHEIIGLIHFSDLNDPVVKLPFFVLLEGVERQFADQIKDLLTADVLPVVIRDPQRVKALRDKMANLQAGNAERDWVTLLYFREILETAVHFHKLSLQVPEIEDLSTFRSRVAHAAGDELIEKHGDVKRLSRVLELCVDILLGGRAA
jgi:hypothetical protein